MESPLLSVPPAEAGLLLQRRSHPRLVGAALLGLAARGRVHVECTSPTRFQTEPSWWLSVVNTDDDDGGACRGGAALRPHEERLLDAVRRASSATARTRRELRDLDDVDDLRGSGGAARVERALRRDAAERGWLGPPPRRRPTASARALRAVALQARADLLAGERPWTSRTLALATALDALPPTGGGGTGGAQDGPAWLTPGRRGQDRGWSGALQLARALSASGESGGWDWTSLPELVGALLDLRH